MLQRTKEWLELDSDPSSRAAVESQLAAQDWGALRSAMCSRLEFGTAGLRAVMAPGFARMNAVTVQQATQGLVVYLQEQAPSALAEGGVVIGESCGGRHTRTQCPPSPPPPPTCSRC